MPYIPCVAFSYRFIYPSLSRPILPTDSRQRGLYTRQDTRYELYTFSIRSTSPIHDLICPLLKIADWLEFYARSLELNVWTSSTVSSATQGSDGIWKVVVKRHGSQGADRIFRVKHIGELVQCRTSLILWLMLLHSICYWFGRFQ